MGWDRSWSFNQKNLSLNQTKRLVETIAAGYVGVTVVVEKEAEDCLSCFFSVPTEENQENTNTIEISIYTMGKNTYVLSLEADASDNRMSEDADQLAEDMAEAFHAIPLED